MSGPAAKPFREFVYNRLISRKKSVFFLVWDVGSLFLWLPLLSIMISTAANALFRVSWEEVNQSYLFVFAYHLMAATGTILVLFGFRFGRLFLIPRIFFFVLPVASPENFITPKLVFLDFHPNAVFFLPLFIPYFIVLLVCYETTLKENEER